MLYLQNRKCSYNITPYLQIRLEEYNASISTNSSLVPLSAELGSAMTGDGEGRGTSAALTASVCMFHTAVTAHTHRSVILCSSCCHSCFFCESCKEAHCTPSGKESNLSEVTAWGQHLPKSW